MSYNGDRNMSGEPLPIRGANGIQIAAVTPALIRDAGAKGGK
jgi:hypothetical protein